MKSSKRTTAALTGAMMALVVPGQAEATKIIGSLTTDSSGYAYISLPLLTAHWNGETELIFKTPFSVTSQVVGTTTEHVYSHPGYQLLGIYNNVLKTPLQTTTLYRTIYSVPSYYPWYRGNRLYSEFSNLEATLNVISAPGTKIDYEMTVLALPEPSTWALMILGFGGIGAAMRRRASAGRVTARVSYSQ
ncbi:PEPxxWA-CTERM sorting domain-containing protein [Sphingobium sp. DEHP117]|uniref:PEPxxWA-CTERM sorting domain-containing protein n=1 Tax=Sphingobium sp. DEHP117 TaxID=2993436 RepID=UPI0027D5C04D|nr:PEPxxWA-CTERM sorting domain-containing protein [Sphingobium sp. DEHP117]MDQ4420067.1 PEPxxWA-CTERM sorting domain-containing protein [Sphingobium sp. DEHP117]